MSAVGDRARTNARGSVFNHNQQFEFIEDGAGWVQIRNTRTGMCLDVGGARTDNTAPVIQWRCGGQQNQQWKLVPHDGGWFHLVARHSGKCLDQTGPSADNGGLFQQWSCKDINNQLFRLVE